MEQELNIAAILKDKPVGTKLYSPCCGVCTKGDDGSSKRPITLCLPNRALYHLLGNGKEFESGEIMVYPSKEMRDWSKFAWKKGDVLKCGTDRFCIFDTWSNDDYTKFEARRITPTYISADVETNMYIKANDTEKAEFIKELEKYWGDKLNLDQFKAMDWCLMRRGNIDTWHLCQYSDTCDDGYYAVGGNFFKECIPYNEKTAHLLGTTDGYEEGGEG